MAIDQENPVKAEQLRTAKTYAEFLDWAKPELRERFQSHEAEIEISGERTSKFRDIRSSGGFQVVLLGEDWCPDVQRTLPLLKGVTKATGWDLKVLRRDENTDVMDRFPARGDIPRIPTVLFLEPDTLELHSVWIERPQIAHEQTTAYQDQTPEAERDMQSFHWDHRQEWRDATLSEWVKLISD